MPAVSATSLAAVSEPHPNRASSVGASVSVSLPICRASASIAAVSSEIRDTFANLEAQHPAMATLFSGENGMLGQAYRVVIFDPTRFSSGHLMVGMLALSAAQPATDLTTAASALKSELNSMYKLSGLTSATLQLPAGPTIKITASMSVSGTSMKLVEYAVFASAHTFIVLLMSTSGDWAGYSKTFDTIPTTLQEI